MYLEIGITVFLYMYRGVPEAFHRIRTLDGGLELLPQWGLWRKMVLEHFTVCLIELSRHAINPLSGDKNVVC